MLGRPREELRRCTSCRTETWFQTPLCDDVTGEPLLDELACVECGTAVLVGMVVPAAAPRAVGAHGHAA